MNRIADWVVRRPWTIVSAFLLVWLAAGALYGRGVRYDFSFNTMAPHDTPEFEVFSEFARLFGASGDIYAVVFRDSPLITAANLERIERLTRGLESLSGTESVLSLTSVNDIRGAEDALVVEPFVESIPSSAEGVEALRRRLVSDPALRGTLLSEDGTTTALVGRLAGWAADPNVRIGYFREVQRLLDEESGGRIEFHLAGSPYLDQAVMGHIFADASFYVPLILTLYTGVLWLVFRRARAAWIPMLPLLIAATVTMGTMAGIGLPLSMLTGSGTLPILIMVIGFSDAVHLMSHYEDEIAASPGEPRSAPLQRTVRHLGVACLLTSLTTAVGLGSLAISDVPAIRDFGIFGAFGVMMAYAAVILVVPSAMWLVERRRPGRARPPGQRDALDRLLERVAEVVVRAPRTIVAIGLAVLAASALLILQVRIDNRFTTDLRDDDPVMRSLRFIESHFGGVLPFEVLVRGPGPGSIHDPELLEGVERLRAELAAQPAVSAVLSPTEFVKRLNRAMHAGDPSEYRLPATRNAIAQYLLLFEMAGGDEEYNRLISPDNSVLRLAGRTKDVPPEEIDRLRAKLHELAAKHLPAGVTVQESGYGPLFSTATRIVLTTLLQSLYLAMPIIFVVIGVSFRSATVGLLSALPNVIPLTFALGFLGVTGIPLRFATIVAFPLAFGIAVDDTIHFLARYRTEIRSGAEPEEAVRRTFRTTGRAMVLTTLFLVGGYLVMTGSSFLATSQIALLAALILTVALVGDLFLTPALLLLLRPRLR